MRQFCVMVLFLAAGCGAWSVPGRRVGGLFRQVGGRGSGAVHSRAFDDEKGSENEAVPVAAVGACASLLGIGYPIALREFIRAVWSDLPAFLAKRGGLTPGPWMIPATTTVGGLAVGFVSSSVQSGFGGPNFVAGVRGQAPFPPMKGHLVPFLVLSFLSTGFGFSVGPEAPMVVAGALFGSGLGRRFGLDERRMALAGAVGAATSAFGIPMVPAILVVELLSPRTGLGDERHLSLALIASASASLVCALFRKPTHMFDWGVVPHLPPFYLLALAVPVGVASAFVGDAFVRLYRTIKRFLATRSTTPRSQIIAKGVIGLIVGLIARSYPQTLFWGETSMQNAIDGQALSSVTPNAGLLIPASLATAAVANVQAPLGAAGLQVGAAKLGAIALAAAAGFPGGVIYPLFFAAAALVTGLAATLPVAGPTQALSMCAMGAINAVVTRTPLTSFLLLAFQAKATNLANLLPLVAVSSYAAVWTATALDLPTFYEYPPREDKHD